MTSIKIGPLALYSKIRRPQKSFSSRDREAISRSQASTLPPEHQSNFRRHMKRPNLHFV